MISQKIKCVYTLKPGRISTVGLQDIDFSKIKFMTIIANGKSIMDSGHISNSDHVRIKIRPDLGVKCMSKQEAEKLKEFAEGTTVDSGQCPSCKVAVKCDLKEYGEDKKCNNCDSKLN